MTHVISFYSSSESPPPPLTPPSTHCKPRVYSMYGICLRLLTLLDHCPDTSPLLTPPP